MYIDTKAVDLEYGSVTNLLHSYDWIRSRFDNIETKAVESEIQIKLRIHSIRTNRVDSTVLDIYGANFGYIVMLSRFSTSEYFRAKRLFSFVST